MGSRIVTVTSVLFLLALGGCAGTGWDPAEIEKVREKPRPPEVTEAIEAFKKSHKDIQLYFDQAYAYAIFPRVTKAAAGLGGAYGEGYVYSGDKLVGLTTLSQGTLGVQLGAQTVREILFFKDKAALETLKKGGIKLGAQASAVATDAGAATGTSYNRGVAVFVLSKAGLMFEASIGGQEFTWTPLED
jgi:lipid-binding SYLF domain-containing protein